MLRHLVLQVQFLENVSLGAIILCRFLLRGLLEGQLISFFGTRLLE